MPRTTRATYRIDPTRLPTDAQIRARPDRTPGAWAHLTGISADAVREHLSRRGWRWGRSRRIVQAPCAGCGVPLGVDLLTDWRCARCVGRAAHGAAPEADVPEWKRWYEHGRAPVEARRGETLKAIRERREREEADAAREGGHGRKRARERLFAEWMGEVA